LIQYSYSSNFHSRESELESHATGSNRGEFLSFYVADNRQNGNWYLCKSHHCRNIQCILQNCWSL